MKHEEAKRGFVLLPRRWVVERSFDGLYIEGSRTEFMGTGSGCGAAVSRRRTESPGASAYLSRAKALRIRLSALASGISPANSATVALTFTSR